MNRYQVANYRLLFISHWLASALGWESAFSAKMVGEYAYKANVEYCVIRAADNCLCRISLEAIEGGE